MQTETDKRTAILQATLDLIAERGFHGTTMSLIVRRAGVSAGTIYHYFESKDAIIHDLYRSIKRQYGTALLVGDPFHLPAPDNLIRVWLNAFQYHISHPHESLFLEQYENSPYLASAPAIRTDEQVATLIALVAPLMQQGVLADMPLDVHYVMTLGIAAALARRQIAGLIALDEPMQRRIAAACYRAVAQPH